MKRFSLILMLLWPLLLPAANPSYQSFNTDQFGTENNKIAVKYGARMTNIVYREGTNEGLIRLSYLLTNQQDAPLLYPLGSRIVVVADSLLAGSAGYPYTAFTLFRAIYGDKYTYYTNCAYSGQTCESALTNFAARAAGWAPSDGTNTYLWDWTSTINLSSSGGANGTATNLIFCNSNILQCAVTNGYTGILLFNSHNYPDQWLNDTEVNAYNEWCRTNSLWNWFIDTAKLTDTYSLGDSVHLKTQVQYMLFQQVLNAHTRRYARNVLDGSGGGGGATYNSYYNTNITYQTNVTIGATNLSTVNNYNLTNTSLDEVFIGALTVTNPSVLKLTNTYSISSAGTSNQVANWTDVTNIYNAFGGAGTNMPSLNLAWVTNDFSGSNIVIDLRKGNNHISFLTTNALIAISNAYGGLHGTLLFVQDGQTNAQHAVFNIVGSKTCGLHTNSGVNPAINTNVNAITMIEFQTWNTNLFFLSVATNWSPLNIAVADSDTNCVNAGFAVQPVSLTNVTGITFTYFCSPTNYSSVRWQTNGVDCGVDTTNISITGVAGLGTNTIACIASNDICGVYSSAVVYLVVTNGSALVDGLVMHYKMDEASGVRADSLGGNGLTNAGDVFQADGLVDSSTMVTAAGYLYANTESKLEFTNADWTLAVWWYPLNNYQAGYPISKASASSGEFSFYWGVSGTNTMQLAVYTNVNAAWGVNIAQVPTNTWNFMLCQWEASSMKFYYVTGTVASLGDRVTNTVGQAMVAGTTNIFGVFNQNYGSIPACRVDELAKWNRLLTPAEITKVWQAGTNGTTYPYPGY